MLIHCLSCQRDVFVRWTGAMLPACCPCSHKLKSLYAGLGKVIQFLPVLVRPFTFGGRLSLQALIAQWLRMFFEILV